jgi:predicted ATPase
LTREEVQEALQGLRRKELIHRREASAFTAAVEYAFKHDLLRQVAYESVLKKVRRVYHGQVGAWLIENGRERVLEFAGLVAAHFEHAARITEAAQWYGRAGLQARTGYSPASAIGFLQKAVTLLPAIPDREPASGLPQMDWHEWLAEALGAQARFDEAHAAYQAERTLAEAAGDVVNQARAWNGLAFLAERQGNYRASVERAERAELLATNAGPLGRGERIRAMHLKGWAFYRLGDAPAVLATGGQTLKLCLEFNDQRGLATSYKLHGVAHLLLGHFQQASHYFESGLAIAQGLGDRRNACAMWSNLGESARLRGDSQAAAELYQRALALAREIGNRESEIIYLSNLAGARLGLREFELAEQDLRLALKLAVMPTSCALAEAYSFLSEACRMQGKWSEAFDAAQHALALAQASESGLDRGSAWRALARASDAVNSRDPSAAAAVTPQNDPRACFAESLKVFAEMKAEGEEARTLRSWAEFELRQGRLEAGREMLEKARSIFLRLGADGEVAQMDAMSESIS